MELFEEIDQLCRKSVSTVFKQLNINLKAENFLDPVNVLGRPVKRDSFNPITCYSTYVPPEFVSLLNIFILRSFCFD